MIHHVFNSSLVSGPETLVLPNLKGFSPPITVVLLQETRLPAGSAKVADYARELGFSVKEIPVRGRFDRQSIAELRRYWQSSPPRLVHAHGPKASLFTWQAARKLDAKPKLLTTHHGVRANDQSLKLKLFETIYERFVIPHFDRCLTVCSSDREVLIRRGVPDRILRVHLNGTDRTRLSSQDRQTLGARTRSLWASALNLPRLDGFLIGVVGRLSPEKQHEKILRIFSLLQSSSPELKPRLLCFGTGPLEPKLRRISHQLGIEDRVHWLGYRSDITTELSGLDLLLSYSSAEGLPINIIEAGWSLTPVIARGIDGIRDLIVDEQSGLLLSPNSTLEEAAAAIGELATHPEGAARLAEALQARVAGWFSRSAWIAELRKIYEEALPGIL